MNPDHGIRPSGRAGPDFPSGALPALGRPAPEEVALLDYLRGDPNLSREAVIYEGALQVALEATNTDWMALAAHDTRELMDHLPYLLQGKPLPNHPDLRSRVRNLCDHHWKSATPALKTECDAKCATLVEKAGEFFDQFEMEFPTKRAAFAAAQRAVGVMPDLLPPQLQKEVEDRWLNLSSYFINICHHNTPDTAGRFREQMTRFARFTLDRLAPPRAAVEDIDRLDAAIREHE
jgi:hypothetical protein